LLRILDRKADFECKGQLYCPTRSPSNKYHPDQRFRTTKSSQIRSLTGYLIQLQRHARQLAANPIEWMPWNYRERLARAEV
jgi:hypothetical protein